MYSLSSEGVFLYITVREGHQDAYMLQTQPRVLSQTIAMYYLELRYLQVQYLKISDTSQKVLSKLDVNT